MKALNENRKLIFLKTISIFLLAVIVYLFAGNMAKYFQWRELKNPFLPEYFRKERSDSHLRVAIVLFLFLKISVLSHKSGRYARAIRVSLFVLLLINYFPQLFG